jgi:two-component system chemotaxis response regulator CheB
MGGDEQIRDVICIGASAGGVAALARITADLPLDLDAAVVVLMLLTRDSLGTLPAILSRRSTLPVEVATDRTALARGEIRVAPPGARVCVSASETLVEVDDTDASAHASIDELFTSAALALGARVIGVILSGELHDGTAGMLAIRRAGGVTVVQSPDDAFAASMPRAVIQAGAADHIVSLRELGALLGRLVRGREQHDVPA